MKNWVAWGLAAILAVVVLGSRCPVLRDWFDLLQFFTSPALREIPFRMETARTILQDVNNGTLKADRNGRITLQSSLASATKDGRVYVTRKGNGLLLVLFPTWRGKGGNVSGYLYCNQPLAKVGIHDGDDIGLAYNPFLASTAPPPEPVEVTLERKVGPSWYYVHRGLD